MHTSTLYYQSLTVHNQFILSLLAAKITMARAMAASDLSTHHSKTAAQSHYRNSIYVVVVVVVVMTSPSGTAYMGDKNVPKK